MGGLDPPIQDGKRRRLLPWMAGSGPAMVMCETKRPVLRPAFFQSDNLSYGVAAAGAAASG